MCDPQVRNKTLMASYQCLRLVHAQYNLMPFPLHVIARPCSFPSSRERPTRWRRARRVCRIPTKGSTRDIRDSRVRKHHPNSDTQEPKILLYLLRVFHARFAGNSTQSVARSASVSSATSTFATALVHRSMQRAREGTSRASNTTGSWWWMESKREVVEWHLFQERKWDRGFPQQHVAFTHSVVLHALMNDS